MRIWLPFQLETIAGAPMQDIDTRSVEQVVEEANTASALATEAAAKAFENEKNAREAQVRIHAHNEEVAGKLFGKPAGWRKLGGGQYVGYTATDHEGDLVPHGEGEQWFQSGNYLCADHHMQFPKGLTFWHFADGAERVGWFDAKANMGSCVDRTPSGVITAGDYAPGGMGHTQKLGLIQYPDGSQYIGFCDYAREADYWAPSGFGVWDSGRSLACLGYFEDGLLSGECAISTKEGLVAGKASYGRLIAKAAEIRF
jgi:hypothetical protein